MKTTLITYYVDFVEIGHDSYTYNANNYPEEEVASAIAEMKSINHNVKHIIITK